MGDDVELVEGGIVGGLSFGVIVGIVIGFIVGVVFFFVICVCCVVRGFWYGVMVIFGFGKKDKRIKEIIIEEECYICCGFLYVGCINYGLWYGG